MSITRIKPPKFRVGRYVLNEYEIRQFCLEVARGERKPGIIIKDAEGNRATILRDGRLSNNLKGWDVIGNIELAKHRVTYYMREAQKNWEVLGDIPVNEDNELEEEFVAETRKAGKISFAPGLSPEDVWYWFEEFYGLNVAEDLMYTDFRW
jgi:hypothetical protein